MKRREFISQSLITGTFISTGLLYACSKPKKQLKVLVLGGTNFVGPAIVNAALNSNHDITLFNRGITNPDLFGNLRLLKGDREQRADVYEQLKKENWDVVIDVWPEKSYLVEDAVTALAKKAKHYIFISSIAVYNNFQEVGLHEDSDVVSLDLARDDWTYSEEKLAAENAIRKGFPDNHTIIRAGAIKGWRDPALDLLYWCLQLKESDKVLAPGSGNDPIQFVDVKDIGKFAIHSIKNNLSGTFNLVGPNYEPLLWKDFLSKAKSYFNATSQLIWASEDFLSSNDVYSFSDLPLWAPLSEDRGFMQISNSKLKETGFEFTAMENTLDDCVQWYENNGDKEILFGTEDVGIGLEKSKQEELIKKLMG